MKKENKSHITNPLLFLMSIIIFIIGIGIFAYPAVSNYLAQINQREVITVYDNQIDESHQEEIERQWELAEIYNDNLAGDPLHDPFIPGSGYALPDNYLEVLNVSGDGVIGYIEIPKINVYLPIYHGTDEEVLQKGAGHLEGSALPIGGKGRNSVISAHRGLPSAELFTRLDEMEISDVFYIHVLDEILAYEVYGIDVIEPEQLEELSFVENEDLVTLLTCTPYAVNTHRLLVRGQRIAYVEEEADKIRQQAHDGISKWLYEYLFAILLGIILLIVIIWLLKKKRRSYEQES